MATNPFKLICADCKTPWRDGDKFCWNCGSANFADNPDYGQTVAPAKMTPVRFDDPKEPDPWTAQSAAQWVLIISTAIAVLIYFGVRNTMDYAWAYAIAAGLVIAGNAWIICLIILTNSKVERIGRMLEEMNKRG